ncbi:MAG TPA: M15 family metallopeptidase [Steroidobacteraceae bacterium]|nr:M15 family metallopeptidase [Steroidobacteraceae bacterium]
MAEMPQFSAEMLTGRSREHIVDVPDPRCSLHREVVAPFLAMRASAKSDGIDLMPASSFRDFDRQLAIWNGKCRGERELLDVGGAPLDARALDEDALVDAILVWSALPGASRHHWGTDLDVFDAAAVPPEYRVQLVPEEYAPGGVFGKLGRWLDANAERHGFFRPYAMFRGGSRPEPWHLSHAAVAGAAQRQFSVDMLREALESASLGAAAAVQRRLPDLFARYVCNVDPPPADAPAAPGATRATRPA